MRDQWNMKEKKHGRRLWDGGVLFKRGDFGWRRKLGDYEEIILNGSFKMGRAKKVGNLKIGKKGYKNIRKTMEMVV